MAVAFVDETGDPGTGGAGRPWFCWVAFVVLNDCVAGMKVVRSHLAGALPGNAGSPANWSAAQFTGDDLIGTLRFLNDVGGWHWIAVASNTTLSTRETASYIHDATDHRYYTMLIMLERLSWLGEALGEPVAVFIEKPNDRHFTEGVLRSRHAVGLPHGRANYNFLPADNIFFAAPANQPLLCLADTQACAVGKAVNPHLRRCETMAGQVFPEYLQIVWKRVWVGPWRGFRNLTNRGFTLLPADRRSLLRAQLPFLEAWLQELDLTS